MPVSPLPRCRKCKKRVKKRGVAYCEDHLRAQYKHEQTLYPSDPFYSSPQWRRNAKSFLRLHPFCEMCEKNNISSPSRVADHIVARLDGGPDYDWENLQALCHSCHNRKRSLERWARGKAGKGTPREE